MSDYRYETSNERLDIKTSADPENVFMWVHEGREQAAIRVPNADVPTIAAELLKAAGQESVIVPKSKVGEVIPVEVGFFRFEGDSSLYPQSSDWWAHRIKVAEEQLADSLRYLALAKVAGAWIESTAREAAEKAEAEAAEKKLRSRRGALARELLRLDVTYDELGRDAPMRAAIDRIIELEDGASRD